MFIFKLDGAQIKEFMQKLLREEVFDGWEVRSVHVQNFMAFDITGACEWGRLRPYVFNIISGNQRPSLLKIILALPQSEWEKVHPNGSSFFLNINFDGEELLCTTATSEKVFTMDKTVDAAWDNYVKMFMAENQIYSSL